MSGTPRGKPPFLEALVTALDEADESVKLELADRLRPYLLAEDPGRLLSAEEKAEQLGLHPDTLVRMARNGRIPGAIKAGRAWRFRADCSKILPLEPPTSMPDSPAPRRRRSAPARRSVAAIRGRV
jgi:excisionase family DNA binding protein